MSKIHAVITGMGAYVPKYVMTNEEISTMVDTSDEWITQRIGIKERRILKPEEGRGVSYLAQKAIEDLQRKKDFDPLEIDAVVFATITPDYTFPQAANLVAWRMGMKNAFGFDMSAACSGFLYGLEVASSFITSGKYKKVILLSGEVLSTITDTQDRNTLPIFADGCGCALLEATTEDVGVMDSILRSNGDSVDILRVYAGGSVLPASHETIDQRLHYMKQEGQVVYKMAVSSMVKTTRELLQRNNLKKEDVDWVVPHQANLRIIDSVAHYLDIPIEKVMINIQKYGNTSAGTIPICLNEWESKLRKGDNVILTAFGGGFTWGSTYLKWGYDPK